MQTSEGWKTKMSELSRGKDYLWRQGEIEVSKENKLRFFHSETQWH